MLLFLGATGLQMLLAIALLPLTTLRLTAADFGYLALVMSIVAFANALSDCGGTLALPVHFAAESEGERRRMIASFFVVTLTVSVALAVLFALSWVPVAGRVLDADGQPFSWTIDILAAAIIPLRSASMLSTAIFSVSGRGNAIAAQIAVQAIGNFLGTLICLFGLEIGTASLFAGTLVGQLASVVVSLAALGAMPWARPSMRWLSVVRHHAPYAAFAGVTDGARAIGENAVIAANLTIASVGYYSHARLYYGMLLSATSAVAHNIWSTSLAEARDLASGFRTTNLAWTPVHILITVMGIGFVCFGRELLFILTNDRLTPAASIVPWFAVLMLISLSGRPQNAMIYVHGAGADASRFRAAIALIVLASFPFVVGQVGGIGLSLGLSGTVALLIFEALIFRFYIRWKARQFGKLHGFQDGWAFGGCLLIVATSLIDVLYVPSFTTRSAAFLVLAVAVVIFERRRIGELLSTLGLMRGFTPTS
ncbi:oligosaccharide flippase family protein [Bradyrhizobium sp. 25ACV]